MPWALGLCYHGDAMMMTVTPSSVCTVLTVTLTLVSGHYGYGRLLSGVGRRLGPVNQQFYSDMTRRTATWASYMVFLVTLGICIIGRPRGRSVSCPMHLCSNGEAGIIGIQRALICL